MTLRIKLLLMTWLALGLVLAPGAEATIKIGVSDWTGWGGLVRRPGSELFP